MRSTVVRGAWALTQVQLLGGEPTSRSESRNLSLRMESEGLAAVKREGRAIVAARERQVEGGESGPLVPAAGNEPDGAPWAAR